MIFFVACLSAGNSGIELLSLIPRASQLDASMILTVAHVVSHLHHLFLYEVAFLSFIVEP